MNQYNFLAEENRLTRLNAMGDPLEKAAAAVDWEMFRPVLDEAFKKEATGPRGRPAIDRIMMFKIVMPQQWYHIADDIPEDWRKAENSAKLSQKDTDARWAKKGGGVHFGYKDHVKVDKDSKLIVDFDATSAEVHDSQCFRGLIDEQDKEVCQTARIQGKNFKKK